jgi:hypothetical protein
MEYLNMKTAKQQILTALTKKQGATLTVPQARSRFGIRNVSARVNELRQDGHFIVTETKTNKSGEKTYFYRLGS